MSWFEQFPYTNFHNLNLDWILEKIKLFEGVIDGLDMRISEIVAQQLDDKNLQQMILDALTEYGLVINVKAPPNNLPPAIGDGSFDDTVAIQGCIDYATSHAGKTVFFPSGKYLTKSLTLKNDVSLVGFDDSTTFIVHKGGATDSLLKGECYNNTITGLTFDNNMDIQVNNIDNIVLTGGKYNFINISLTDGYNSLKLNLNDIASLNNIKFGDATVSHLVTSGVGSINADNLYFKNLSQLNGRFIIDNTLDRAVFTGIYSTCQTSVAIKNTSNGSVFIGKIINAISTHTETGNSNFYNFYDRGGSIQDLVSNEKNERQVADALLQTNINTEKTTRENADIVLQNNINTEKTTRENADNTLQNNINTEQSNRISADINLQENINTEKTEREEAITELENQILSGGLYINVLYPPPPLLPATGNGVTDDSVAIQAIVNYAIINSMNVVFPATTAGYHFGDIVITGKIAIRGIGNPWNKVIGKASSNTIFDIRNREVTISNFVFEMQNVTDVNSTCFLLNTSSEFGLYEVRIEKCMCWDSYCFIKDSNGAGVIVNTYISDCTCVRPRGTQMLLRDTGGFIYFIRCGVDMTVNTTTVTFPAWKFENTAGLILNDCDALGHGFNMPSNANAKGFEFINCQAVWFNRVMCDFTGGIGVYMTGCSYMYLNDLISSICLLGGLKVINSTHITGSNIRTGGTKGASYAVSNISGADFENVTGLSISSIYSYNNTRNGVGIYNCKRCLFGEIIAEDNTAKGFEESESSSLNSAGNSVSSLATFGNGTNFELIGAYTCINLATLNSGSFLFQKVGPFSI